MFLIFVEFDPLLRRREEMKKNAQTERIEKMEKLFDEAVKYED